MFDPPSSVAPITPGRHAAPVQADEAPVRLHTLTCVANAPSPDLSGLMSAGIPALIDAMAGLPRADRVSLAVTSQAMRAAMWWVHHRADTLYLCAATGDADGVRRSLRRGLPFDEVFNPGMPRDTALTIAVRNNVSGVVDQIVRSDRFDPDDPASEAALRLGVDLVAEGQPRVCNIVELLTHGVAASCLSDEQWKSCLLLIQDNRDVARHLLWHPAVASYPGINALAKVIFEYRDHDYPRIPDRHGRTPLHWGAAYLEPQGCVALMNYLRARPPGMADVVDHAGRTMLHYAAESGSHRTVRLLLHLGLDAGTKDAKGLTPLDAARAQGMADTSYALVQYLAKGELS